MATKVTKYETNDGTLFDNRQDAEYYDAVFAESKKLLATIEDMTVYGNVDPSELYTQLTTGTLGREVIEYHKVANR